MLSGPSVNKLSKNHVDPLVLGTSVVNCMCGSMELLCCKNCCLCSAFWMTKVSSTYLSHSLGGWRTVLIASDSKSSMNRLTTTGLIGEPMAAPWTCL